MVFSNKIAIATVATPLFTASRRETQVIVILDHNPNAGEAYIGGSNVTASNGFVLPLRFPINMILGSGDILYAVGPNGGNIVSILVVE